MTPRLLERYREEIVPKLLEEFSYVNVHQVPGVEKVVVNIGVGEATQNPKLLERAVEQLGQITGQKANIRRARKSVSNFKLREGQAIGAMVTLRGSAAHGPTSHPGGNEIQRGRERNASLKESEEIVVPQDVLVVVRKTEPRDHRKGKDHRLVLIVVQLERRFDAKSEVYASPEAKPGTAVRLSIQLPGDQYGRL